MIKNWVYLCFFISGFGGLVYEVVWSRLFVYTMGSSHLSIAVVVSVFMGGLALGSALGGLLADRAASPLRLYGWLVIGAGLLSAAVVPEIGLLGPILGAVYRLNDGSPSHPLFTLAKAAVCAVTILLPTTCMGATLPALARHLARSSREIGARLGSLYAVNTFGAVAGAGAAGFFLIPRLGLLWSMLLAAAGDIAAGAAVLALSRRGLPAAGSAAARRASGASPALIQTVVPLSVRAAVLAFAVSGFANMCLQLGWTRALVVSIGNSTYSFSIIVGIFIFGLAGGGWIAGLLADRLKNPALAFGWLLIATSAAAAITIPWLGLSPATFAWKLGKLAAAATKENPFDFTRFLFASAWQVALMILPATLLMGMAFPIVGRLRTLSEQALGRSVGFSYAANTLGAILGTAATGFFLMPLLGRIWAILYLAVGLSFLAGAAVLAAAPISRPRRWAHLGTLGLVAALLLAAGHLTRPYELRPPAASSPGRQEPPVLSQLFWHPVVFALGAYINVGLAGGFKSSEDYARHAIEEWNPLYYRDGEDGSVAVLQRRKDGLLSLNISGKIDASAAKIFSFDLQTQLLMGHLALLVHPAPKGALNLGLGCGMSLGAMVSHSAVEQVDMIEISPEVVEAARRHFSEANKKALDHPKVRNLIGDGRNHLAHTAKRYDVISSGPSNFWIAGIGNLFTQEYYRLLLDRLEPGGIVCQWIYGYSIRAEDYKLALRTILSVFPHVTVWTNSYGDTIFLSAREPIVFDRDRIAAALSEPAVRADLAPIGITTPEDLFRYFRAEGAMLEGWVGEGAVNRDLVPVLEFTSPLGFFETNTDIIPAMAAAGQAPLAAGLFRNFSAEQIRAIEAYRRHGRAMVRCVNLTYGKKFQEAGSLYEGLAQDGDGWSLLAAAREIARMTQVLDEEARIPILNQAREAHDTPDLQEAFRRATQPLIDQVAAAVRASQPAEALKLLEKASRWKVAAHHVAHLRGLALATRGNLPEAASSLREAFEKWPAGAAAEKGEVAHNLGRVYERQERFEEALAAYEQSRGLGFNAAIIGVARSRCFRALGRGNEAVREASAALGAAGSSKSIAGDAAAELGRAHGAAGNWADAVRWLEEAAKAAPGRYDRELEEARQKAGR
ncbi:MAG: fused MFS/spermidine synthase [Planctomycetes bacterium]|nr:fused MFS/spermidine synthase [Planctomycetota bacterium]